MPVPATFYLAPGDYDVTAEYRGEQATTRASVVAGSDRELSLGLPEPPGAPEPVARPEEPPLFPARPPPDEVAQDDSQKTWGWVGVGAGVVLGVAAAALGAKALSARDRFHRSDNTDADAYHEAKDLRLATNVLWGGATAAGAAGLVLLLTAPSIEF
jgi:hypothetical protein